MRSVANRIRPSYLTYINGYWNTLGPMWALYNDTTWHDVCAGTMSTGGTNNPSGTLFHLNFTCLRSGLYALEMWAHLNIKYDTSSWYGHICLRIYEKNYIGQIKSMFTWYNAPQGKPGTPSESEDLLAKISERVRMIKGNVYDFQVQKSAEKDANSYLFAIGDNWNVGVGAPLGDTTTRRVACLKCDFIGE